MALAKSRRGILRVIEKAPKGVAAYFEHLPTLLESLPLDVSLSYVFSRVELAHNMTLYCGVVKKHRTDAVLTRKVINTQHMTRGQFRDKFQTVFGESIPNDVAKPLADAEKVRDLVMHGKSANDASKRQAIVAVIDYARAFNDLVSGLAGFRPFGDLRGFKGRSEPLDKATTRWVLRGMGFDLS